VDIKPLKWYKSLKTHKGRMAEAFFLIEGPRAIEQIARHPATHICEVLIGDSRGLPAWNRFPVRRLSQRQFVEICASQTPQGIAAVVAIPSDSYSDSLPANPGNRILYLDDIQDPGNVGTLIRTAAALGWSGVILSEKCADPFSPKAVQSAAGATLSVWVRKTIRALEMVTTLKHTGAMVIAADVKGKDLLPIVGQGGGVLMLGNEGNGLSDTALSLADALYRIPIVTAAVESLNVAAAGAICMHALRR
jgi:TrmH family RNA methyltransferase